MERVGLQLAQDLYRGKQMRIYDYGAPNAEATWVGTCTTCGRLHVSNLDPNSVPALPDACGSGSGFVRPCEGVVVLHAEWPALLAAFLVGGWDALRLARVMISGVVTV